ncbi:MAG TPA: hypothetical protein IAB12_01195 [Candidatus Ornithospirochaeta avicola]|uniref:Uncharacterized protein n=1 Tax=Candidatus Ornithospirochaeta avicola TaxID=2840896 RepID=A0A9D1PSF9_9SPIO|nr:hypothetical protein [Candidatus Ornithospirochaeta avicola]
MKYHTSAKTVLIALLILFIFSFFSLSFVFYFKAISPAEAALDNLLSSFSDPDGDIYISYSFLDRNLFSSISLNDVEIRYADTAVIQGKRVSVDISIFSALFRAITKSGEIPITLEDFDVQIFTSSDKEASFKDEKKSSENSFTLEDYKDLVLVLSASSVDVIFNGEILFENLNFKSNLDLSKGLFDTSLSIDRFKYEGISAENIRGEADYNQMYYISLTAEKTAMDSADYNVSADNVFSSIVFSDLKSLKNLDFSLSLNADRSNITSNNLEFDLKTLRLRFEDKNIQALFDDAYLLYGEYSAFLKRSQASGGIEEETVSFSFFDIELRKQNDQILNIDEISLDLSKADEKAELNISTLDSSYLSILTNGKAGDALLKNLALEARKNENGYDLSADFDIFLSLNAGGKESLSSSFEILAQYSVEKEEIDYIKVQSEDFKASFLSEELDLALDYENKRALLSLSYSDSLMLSADISENIGFNLDINSLSLKEFSPFIRIFTSEFDAYIKDETRVSSSFSSILEKNEDSAIGYSGEISGNLEIADLNFSGLDFSLSSSLRSNLEESEMKINELKLDLGFISADFKGALDYSLMLPYGSLSLKTQKREILSLSLMLSERKEYSFSLESSFFLSSRLFGFYNFEDNTHLYSDAVFTTENRDYNFALDIDFIHRFIQVTNERASLYVSFDESFDASLILSSFEIINEDLSSTVLDGRFSFSFDFSSQRYSLSSSRINIVNMYLLAGNPSISFYLNADNDAVNISNLSISSSVFETLSGSFVFEFEDKSLAFMLENSSEEFLLSLSSFEDYYSGLMSATAFNLERFGLEGKIDMSLIGRGASLDDIAFTGNFDIENGSSLINGSMSISERDVSFSTLRYSNGNFLLDFSGLEISSTSGIMRLPLSLSYDFKNTDRDYPFRLSLEIDVKSDEEENLYFYFRKIFEYNFENLEGRIMLYNLQMDDRAAQDSLSQISYKNRVLTFSGSFIEGTFSLDDFHAELSVHALPVIDFDLSGSFKETFNLNVKLNSFNLKTINFAFLSPIVIFDEEYASADLLVLGKPGDLHLYGSVYAERVGLDVFWVPDDHLIAHNPVFTVWDNNIKTHLFDATCVDKHTGERKNGKVIVEFNLLPSMLLDYYRVDAYVEDGNSISFRIPMPNEQIDISGSVFGHYYIEQHILDKKSYMGGELTSDNLTMSIGLAPLPQWYSTEPGGFTMTFDFNMDLRSNTTFVYPLIDNPIISAMLVENQKARFHNTRGSFEVEGNLNIRTGELFYFQRYFFIRSGNIDFRSNSIRAVDPVINLRAELKTFDTNGETVDIYLDLVENTLDNINPIFSSTPSKDLNEIMTILGQNILPTGSDTISSVVGILSTGVDVLSRIGILPSGSSSLSKNIRNTLNLDTFSLHSNVIENLVFDAVSAWERNVNLSPLARYLDGTSIYAGKYISSELYLELMLHLVADEKNLENVSFIAGDLSLDFKLSLEWDNPICLVTFFTTPKTFNALDVIENFGFSLTKRFIF